MPTIALVANDRNVMTSVSIVLEAEGYRIAAYTDGASALSGFQTAPPDLAILDIKIPRLDGGGATPTPGEVGPAGDLPHLYQRGNRRGLRLGNGGGRFHPQTVLAAPPHRAGQGRSAPSIAEERSPS